jgi:hypothetical protein
MISRYNISGYWGLQTPQGASTNAARRFNKRRKALQQTPQGASTNAARRFNKRRKALLKETNITTDLINYINNQTE